MCDTYAYSCIGITVISSKRLLLRLPFGLMDEAESSNQRPGHCGKRAKIRSNLKLSIRIRVNIHTTHSMLRPAPTVVSLCLNANDSMKTYSTRLTKGSDQGITGNRFDSSFLPSSRSMRKRKENQGLSLVELLVVICIILGLATLAFTASKKLRSSARQTTCLTNLRQVASSMQMFINESNGVFPSFGGMGEVDDGLQRWMHQLYPYIRPGPASRQKWEPYAFDVFSCPVSKTIYGMNQRMQSNSSYNTGTYRPKEMRIAAVKSPSRTVVVSEKGPKAQGHPSIALSNPFPKDSSYGAAAVHGNGEDGAEGFTKGAGGFSLFADMHVEFLTKWFGDSGMRMTGDPSVNIE
jgi:hypothetical protein